MRGNREADTEQSGMGRKDKQNTEEEKGAWMEVYEQEWRMQHAVGGTYRTSE